MVPWSRRERRAAPRARRWHRQLPRRPVRDRRQAGGDGPARVVARRDSGRARLAGVRHGDELGPHRRMRAASACAIRGRRLRDPGSEHHQHARGNGPVRQGRTGSVGLPERRLASRGRGHRAGRARARRDHLQARRRLGCHHGAGSPAVGSAPRAGPLREGPAHEHAGRLDHAPADG